VALIKFNINIFVKFTLMKTSLFLKSALTRLFFVAAVIVVIIVYGQKVWAQYYVAPSGDDNNPGTLQQPFKTIQKAADVMVAGETCFIMNGEYRETVIPVNNGTPVNPIVFKNYNDQRVVILGTDTVTGWIPYENGIYKAYVPDTVTQLFVNGKRAFPARYPDNMSGDMLNTSDWNPVTAEPDGDAFLLGMNKPENYWVGGYCKILTGHKWVAHIGKISASDGDMVHCDERSFPWNDYNPSVYLGPGMGYIYKHIHALDKVNEWHWQNDTLYYFPESGANIDTMRIEARTRLYGFDCQGKSFIEIDNIHFVFSSVNFGSATGCVLDGGSVWFPAPFFYYENSWVRNAGGGANYSIDHWAGKGIHISGTNNTVKNCYVAYSWGDGISIGGIHNNVENCLIENCDWSATDAGSISATGYGHNITGNTLHTAARSILIHRYCDSTNVKFNNLYDCGLMCDDLGLTYSYHTNGGGSEIAYNWVHDNHASGTASGIYLDNYDSNYVVHHNVVWNCAYAIHTNKPAVNHEIYNNTVWYCANAQWAWGPAGTQIINQQVKNNLSDKPWNVGTVFQTNLTTGNPMFVDPENGDFRLQENSPAIDFGTVIPGITDGYAGAAPDAGAYEYGGEDWVAGSDIEIPDLSDIVVIPQPEPIDLIAYYPFNGNAHDESGNGFNASEIIGATLTADKDGNPNSAYAFDGIDDKIVIPHIGVNLLHDFTIAFWFQPNDSVTRQWLFGNRHTATGEEGNGLESDIFQGDVRFFWPAQLTLSYQLTSDGWQFVVFTKENSSYRLFYNGQLVDAAASTSSPNNNDPWRIGAHFNQDGWGAHFNGKMDEIRVYGRALSNTEIEDLYNGTTTGYLMPEKRNDDIIIFPNPSSSKIYFADAGRRIFKVDVFDSSGVKILEKIKPEEIDLVEYPNGMYLVVAYDENNRVLTLKKVIAN